jgi:Flp pilus assembly pilin Flp
MALLTHHTDKKAQKGQSLAEYGLILALVTVVCIAGLTALGGNIGSLVNNSGNSIIAAISAAIASG